jgi:hypothetical protein
LQDKHADRALYLAALLAGCAVATKISSILFLAIPIAAIANSKDHVKLLSIGTFLIFAGIAAVYFAPHNIISYADFHSAMLYEIGIGQGKVVAFYNRQFDHTVPILFQVTRMFPYVLGLAQFFVFALAALFLPYTKKFNLLRIAFLMFFLPTAFLYAKWTRFISPVMPIMTVFIAVGFLTFVEKLRIKLFYAIIIVLLLPGIAYLSIYKHSDVRFKASNWIVSYVPEGSNVFSETANVVDIPMQFSPLIPIPPYNVVSFDLYHVDVDASLADKLPKLIDEADYIFVPSRRIFANNTCYRFSKGMVIHPRSQKDMLLQGYEPETCQKLSKTYPLINDHYDKLFSGGIPFVKLAEITSYPRISLFGKTLYEIRDENAEETWTVFDHPVIRIYKRI